MATILSFLSGRQITNSNGTPQSGALLYHYQATTTNNLTVYSNQAGTTPHAQPVVCDSGGFVPLIYVGDSSDWKVAIQTSGGATLQTYDNLPAAVPETSAANFAPPLFQWTQVTSASSPVALTAADAGKAYEANTASGNIEFDLPSAASVGNGKGFLFKKTSSSNTMTIDPSGTETIDDTSTSLAILRQYEAIGIYSNGAEWYTVIDLDRPTTPTVQRFTSGSGTYTTPSEVKYIRVRMCGGGGGGGARTTNNGTAGGATSFSTWTANGGALGAAGSVNPTTGGNGGTNGTGTLLARVSGGDGAGSPAQGGTTSAMGGAGGANPFGGAGSGGTNVAGTAAKANTGGGGGGGGSTGGTVSGAGGAAGEYVEFLMTAAQVGASVSYAVGAGGTGGAAGSVAGADGAAGVIIVEEYY